MANTLPQVHSYYKRLWSFSQPNSKSEKTPIMNHNQYKRRFWFVYDSELYGLVIVSTIYTYPGWTHSPNMLPLGIPEDLMLHGRKTKVYDLKTGEVRLVERIRRLQGRKQKVKWSNKPRYDEVFKLSNIVMFNGDKWETFKSVYITGVLSDKFSTAKNLLTLPPVLIKHNNRIGIDLFLLRRKIGI